MKLEGRGYITKKEVEKRPKKDGSGEWEITNLVIQFEGYKDVKKTIAAKSFKSIDFEVGELVDIVANVESREFNGKYYTDVSIWDISSQNNGIKSNVEELPKTETGLVDLGLFESGDNDLPF